MTDPLGHVTSYVYNGLGEQIETVAPDPATGLDDAGSPVTTTSYDADGNVLGVTDPLGHTTTPEKGTPITARESTPGFSDFPES